MLNEQDEENSGSDFRRKQSDSSGIQPPIFVAIMLLFVILYPSLVDNSNQLTDLGDGPNDPDPPLENNSTNPIEPIEPNEPGDNTSNNSTNPHIPSENDTDGDGWTDILENLCGSNGNDSNSVPLDLDGNGLCDEVTTPTWLPGPGEENDTDGDGWADWREDLCDSESDNPDQTPLVSELHFMYENESILSDRGTLYSTVLMEFTERLVNRSSLDGMEPLIYYYNPDTNLERYNHSQNLRLNVITKLDITAQLCSFGAPDNVTSETLDESWYSENSSFKIEKKGYYRWNYLSQGIYDAQPVILRLIAARERGEIVAFWIDPIKSSQQGAQPTYAPNDENLFRQWHIVNSGGYPSHGTPDEDLNISSVWDDYSGAGVHLHFIDTGIDVDHEEFSYLNITNSVDWCEGDNNPNPTVYPNYIDNPLLDDDTQALFDAYHERIGHGTSTVGISNAETNNSIGIAGISMGADFSVGRLISCLNKMDDDELRAEALSYNSSVIDIYSNSWGSKPFANDTIMALSSIENGSLEGRDGKGIIYVFSAGNSRNNSSLSTYHPFPNSRFTISVCAVDRNGELAYYSELGANLLLCGYSDGIFTTDHSGSYGYNTEGDYNSFFSGTSASAPQISGVVALMLEANPSLTWRDVQHILVKSSKMNSLNDESWAISNSTGFNYSHKFGYGVADAGSAVRISENWENVGNELNFNYSSNGLNETLTDGESHWLTIPIFIDEIISLESVELSLEIDHLRHGDLEINLVSPTGRTSRLSELYHPKDQMLNHTKNGSLNWTFTSVAHWGEDSSGYWYLRIRDILAGPENDTTIGGTLRSWNLTIHGHEGLDTDGDGWYDSDEVLCWTSRFHAFSTPVDTDGDGICDSREVDDDNDGYNDWNELICGSDPLDSNSIPSDSDGGQLCDGLDWDDDNDYILDWDDYFPLDSSEWYDYDGDGIGDNADTDDDGDGISDTDSDGDNVGGNADVFPNDPGEWADFDGDGIGDNEDTDDDNDGMPDSADSAPRDSSISTPSFWNPSWIDTDGDLIPDHIDANPIDPDYGVNPYWFTDADGDGVPNWADPDHHGGGSDWIGNHLGLFQTYFPITGRSDYGDEPTEPICPT